MLSFVVSMHWFPFFATTTVKEDIKVDDFYPAVFYLLDDSWHYDPQELDVERNPAWTFYVVEDRRKAIIGEWILLDEPFHVIDQGWQNDSNEIDLENNIIYLHPGSIYYGYVEKVNGEMVQVILRTQDEFSQSQLAQSWEKILSVLEDRI